MKVGIIKGLLYYYDEVLWTNFFDNLGVKTIFSNQPTKETIKIGEELSPSEACLSLKIFVGEVYEIKDKCDVIFIPRLFSTKDHEQVCTNFNSLRDLIKNTFPDVNILDFNIDLTVNKTELKAYVSIGKSLGYSIIASLNAYLKAKEKQDNTNHEKFISQLQKLKTNKKKILLAAHPYILNENILVKEIKDYIKKENFEIIYSNILDDDLIDDESEKLSKTLHWTHSKKLLAGINYYKDKVDGIILLSTFPCGPDSLTNELVKRKVNKPLLNLILESDSNTGILTRLEAFFDIVKVKI